MPEPTTDSPTERLVSLDAYRGFVMLAMASGGFAFPEVASNFPDSQLWSALDRQFEHVRWQGCSFWDLIQPSFMFIVGVAMPFSYAQRAARGEPWSRQFAHALWRSVVLVALGVFLASAWEPRTNFSFVNVLSQIGLGYMFVFLLLGRSAAVQVAAVAAVLVGYWLLFATYPLPGPKFPYREVGLSNAWPFLQGFPAHWEKNTNVAAAFDRWFLNLFPHPSDTPFRFNPEGYATLNFVPSIATMLAGVLAGELLRSRRSAVSKLQALLIVGAVCIAAGSALDGTVCPVVKKIWTPSWVIFSAGWTCWLLAAFYGVIDVVGLRRWAFPLVVVGVNSIAMYLMAQLIKPFIARSLQTHFGTLWTALAKSRLVDEFVVRNYEAHLHPALFQGLHGPIFRSACVLFVLWLICLWMYRRKIFLKI
jgi:predicted acyltransferase